MEERQRELNLEQVKMSANAYSEDEVMAICQLFAKKYPEIMFKTLNDEYARLQVTLNSIASALN